MNKMKRNERVGAIVKILSNKPNKVYSLNYFSEIFSAAKSTISEDLVITRKLMENLSLGRIETIAGAAGGVKFIPLTSKESKTKMLEELCDILNDPKRVVPGGFLYIADILYNPAYMKELGEVFAEMYSYANVDYVITVETKGIPLAMMVAMGLNIPLIVARNENKATEGATISINYVSGSNGRIQTMYVSKNSIPPGSNVLIIDDFMRAGGTIKGMVDLVKELDSTVSGMGVLMKTIEPAEKMITGCDSLLVFEGGASNVIKLRPNYGLIDEINKL